MASLARLDTQLGGLGPPEREMREIEERVARVGRDVGVVRPPRDAPRGTPRGVWDAAYVHYEVSREPAARAPVRAESRGAGGTRQPAQVRVPAAAAAAAREVEAPSARGWRRGDGPLGGAAAEGGERAAWEGANGGGLHPAQGSDEAPGALAGTHSRRKSV